MINNSEILRYKLIIYISDREKIRFNWIVSIIKYEHEPVTHKYILSKSCIEWIGSFKKENGLLKNILKEARTH